MKWRLLYMLLPILALAGCGGSDDRESHIVPTQPLPLVIREWRFPPSGEVITILTDPIPRVTNGVQFDLLVVPPNGGPPIKDTLRNVQFCKSNPIAASPAQLKDPAFVEDKLKRGEIVFKSFPGVISWDDKNVCKFYRIDEQDLKSLYCVQACACIGGKEYPAKLIFRVFCGDVP